MILHHLTFKDKIQSLNEAFRVLRPQGSLHVADIAKPHDTITQLTSLITSRLEQASDNVRGLLPKMLLTAGFDQVTETKKYGTIFGTVALYRVRKPNISK